MIWRRVVVESPYAGDVERNDRYLDACLRDCVRRRETPYASHRMLPRILRDEVPEERTDGLEAGYAWWFAADAVVFYLDLGWSPGMVVARERLSARNGRLQDAFKRHGIPGSVWPVLEERRLGGEWG